MLWCLFHRRWQVGFDECVFFAVLNVHDLCHRRNKNAAFEPNLQKELKNLDQNLHKKLSPTTSSTTDTMSVCVRSNDVMKYFIFAQISWKEVDDGVVCKKNQWKMKINYRVTMTTSPRIDESEKFHCV